MKENQLILEPGSEEGRVRAMRSAVSKALLGPGEFADVNGFRWSTGDMKARGGSAAFLTMPTALSGATFVDMWAGALNGTQYIVIAFLLNSKYEVWVSEAGGALYRLSEVGGWHGGTSGDTRFSSLTGRVDFCPAKSPQQFAAGVVTEVPRDILLVSNGQENIRIFDPGMAVSDTISITSISAATPQVVTTGANHNRDTGDTVVITVGGVNYSYWIERLTATTFSIYHDEARSSAVASGTHTGTGTLYLHSRYSVHQRVTVPADATLFTQAATFGDYWPVRGSSGKTYASSAGPPAVNQANFAFANSSYDVYASSNAVIAWTWGTAAAAGNIAAIYFANDSLYIGRGLILFTEDVTASFGAAKMLSHVKIEAGLENVAYGSVSTWVTIYDPFSSNGYETRMERVQLAGPDTDPPRYMYYFPTDHLPDASRTIYHLRFTRSTNSPAPSTSALLMILAICGAGAFFGGGEFTISYTDHRGRAESYGIVAGGGPSAEAAPFTVAGGGGIPPPPVGGGGGGGGGGSTGGSTGGATGAGTGTATP